MKWIVVWTLLAALPCAGLVVARGPLAIWDVWEDGWLAIGCFGLACVLLIGGAGLVLTWGDSITCRNTAANMGLPHRWSASAGCLVEVNGRWFSIDNVQNVGGKVEVSS